MKFEIDAGQTALENGRRRMQLFRAENPQCTYHDPHCNHEDPEWGPLKHVFEGKPGEWHTYEGPKPFKPCSHKLDEHVRGGATISDSDPLAGRRDRNGAFRIKLWTPPKRAAGLPPRTLENVAACAALGLGFWCESWRNTLVAVDDEQRIYYVEIDRKKQTSWTVGKDRASWAKAPTMAALWEQLGGPLTKEQAADEWREQIEAMDGPPPQTEEDDAVLTGKALENGPGNPMNQPFPGTPEKAAQVARDRAARKEQAEISKIVKKRGQPSRQRGFGADLTAAEAREHKAAKEQRAADRQAEYDRRDAEIMEAAAARRAAELDAAEAAAALTRAAGEKHMTREAARALLLHDPDYLGDITNAALVDLLDDESVAEHHGRIRAELTENRGLTERITA